MKILFFRNSGPNGEPAVEKKTDGTNASADNIAGQNARKHIIRFRKADAEVPANNASPTKTSNKKGAKQERDAGITERVPQKLQEPEETALALADSFFAHAFSKSLVDRLPEGTGAALEMSKLVTKECSLIGSSPVDMGAVSDISVNMSKNLPGLRFQVLFSETIRSLPEIEEKIGELGFRLNVFAVAGDFKFANHKNGILGHWVPSAEYMAVAGKLNNLAPGMLHSTINWREINGAPLEILNGAINFSFKLVAQGLYRAKDAVKGNLVFAVGGITLNEETISNVGKGKQLEGWLYENFKQLGDAARELIPEGISYEIINILYKK